MKFLLLTAFEKSARPASVAAAPQSWLSGLQRLAQVSLAPRWVAWLLSIWTTGLLNQALWHKLASLGAEFSDPLGLQRAGIALLITAATYLWFMLWSWPRVRRTAWTLSLVLAAVVQYYMLHYGVIMDSSMLRNAQQTNLTETLALLTPGMGLHVLLLAGLPALWLWRIRMPAQAWSASLWRSALMVLLALLGLFGGAAGMYRELAPLVRNHTEIRYLINPLATVVSWMSVNLKPILRPNRRFESSIAGSALGASYGAQAGSAAAKPPLLVLIVGETTRSDHFGLNGYPRNTTPELESRQVLSWRDVQSCGTNTLASVPCMFDPLGKDAFEARKKDTSNLLDVLQAAGLGVDWLDNQAGCKGVCARISNAQAEQIASPEERERWCKDGECLDQLMLGELDQRLAALPAAERQRGAVLVLHQMGSHGPAYHRRSSAEAKRYQPECTTHVTSDCSHAELVNVYDNSMAETDLFVARTIDWLKTKESGYATSLIYLADHGESLGENGMYLHGLPYAIAPQVQKQVPWVWWPGSLPARTGTDVGCAGQGLERHLSHDNYYHTVLGLLDVRSPTYQPELDALAGCRRSSRPG